MNIHNLLYTLKKDWAVEFLYFQIIDQTTDDDTGESVYKKKVFKLKACLLPETQLRKFVQDISYLAANKNFTYGALNDFDKVTFLIDSDDLPSNFDMELNGYIVKGNKRYERVSFTNLHGNAFLLICQGVKGAAPYTQVASQCKNMLQLQSMAICELN